MRAIWSGAITFGLVNVPVKLYSATEDHDVHLHQVHDEDGGRIRYERRCDVCGRVVPYEHIDRAFVEEDETVVVTREELAAIPQERSREISVVEFVPSDQIDPILFERSYYLEPAGKSPKAYVLLRRTLERTDRTAIVQFALRQKTRLAALRVRGDVLMVQTLIWADEVREAAFPVLESAVKITSKELQLSDALVKSFSSDFSPESFHDEYQEELRRLIDAKLEHGDALDTDATFGEGESEEGAEVIDLMEALRRSVQQSRTSKRRAGGGAGSRAGGGGRRASAAKKKPAAAPAKKQQASAQGKSSRRSRKSS